MDNQNEPVDIGIRDDLIGYKKKRLSKHVPFIHTMIEKLKGTKFERIWQMMVDCIDSDKKMYD